MNSLIPMMLYAAISKRTEKYCAYVDPETGVVRRPESFGNPFGDGVWRSSWFYASLLVIRQFDPSAYETIKLTHRVDVLDAGRFLTYFRDQCISDEGWQVPNSDQKFSRDQLVPLLYLLATVSAYGQEFKVIGSDILKSLGRLEEHFTDLSNASQGRIGRNIGYLIAVLCDEARYGLNYRTKDLPGFLVLTLGDIDAAKGNRRAAYKTAFSLAVKAHKLTGWLQIAGLDASDEYSVFNALAAVSLQCISWGNADIDVMSWRSNFTVHADDAWGPAFSLVAGRSVTNAQINDYAAAHVTNNLDNDIIMAQRPAKIKSGVLGPSLKGGSGQWLVLDYMILKALGLLWQ